ncbi:NPCBM/NEW2 domain-containing protein [Streptosporangiaceae bacterium NEAU-GS5]|nr:NPCBM/NEW2 domain-containing protein [Streptosporangiaceae bacterium NEAU-GS5]
MNDGTKQALIGAGGTIAGALIALAGTLMTGVVQIKNDEKPGPTATITVTAPAINAPTVVGAPSSGAVTSRSPIGDEFLADLPQATEGSDYTIDGIEIEGHSYPKSLTTDFSYCSAPVSYNLKGRYRTLTTKIAIADDVADDAKFTFKVSLDDKVVRTESVKLGKIENMTVPTAGAYRLTLDIDSERPCEHTDWAAWLTPKLQH